MNVGLDTFVALSEVAPAPVQAYVYGPVPPDAVAVRPSPTPAHVAGVAGVIETVTFVYTVIEVVGVFFGPQFASETAQ